MEHKCRAAAGNLTTVIQAKSEQSYTTKHWQGACTGAPTTSAPAELRTAREHPGKSRPGWFQTEQLLAFLACQQREA